MDGDDGSVFSFSVPGPPRTAQSASAEAGAVGASSATAAAASTAPTPLSRSVSQQSAASSRSHRSGRGYGNGGRRASSRVPRSTASGSSVGSDDNKSLTSFPSFSPELPAQAAMQPSSGTGPFQSPPQPPPPPSHLAGRTSSTASLVDSLLSQSQSSLLPVTAPTTTSPSTSTVIATPATTAAAARNALFEDAPLFPSNKTLPGALHLADDAHIARIIGKHGAVVLVRQLAQDLAQRDALVAAVRARAAERERFLRKIILECGLSSLDLETRLRTLEQEQEARVALQQDARASKATSPTGNGGVSNSSHVSNLMSDAMSDNHSLRRVDSDYCLNDATIRASSGGGGGVSSRGSGVGTTRGWKDFLWGGASSAGKRGSRSSSVAGDAATIAPSTTTPSAAVVAAAAITSVPQPSSLHNTKSHPQHHQTVVRLPVAPERRPVLSDDLFQPPLLADNDPIPTVGQAASSVQPVAAQSTVSSGRKPSLASLALRFVVGGNNSEGSQSMAADSNSGGNNTIRGRKNTSRNTAAATSGGQKTGLGSAATTRTLRATTTATQSGGPRSLMAMRRATSTAAIMTSTAPQNIPRAGVGSSGSGDSSAINARGQAQERWGEMLASTSVGDGLARPEAYGPVEMDTILPLDAQPPTLTRMYNRYNSSGYLIDRFGFIYDQRRKKRQRDEAAQMARQLKRGSRHSEMLTSGGRSSPSLGQSFEAEAEAEADAETNAGAYADTDVHGSDKTGAKTAENGNGNQRRHSASGSSLDSAAHGRKDGSIANSDGRPGSPTVSPDGSVRDTPGAADAATKDGTVKRWQDYLKIATFPTELLSHTPAMSDVRIEVIGNDGDRASTEVVSSSGVSSGPKSPGFLTTADGRGFVPSTSAMAVVTMATSTGLDTDSIASVTTDATADADADARQTKPQAQLRTPSQAQTQTQTQLQAQTQTQAGAETQAEAVQRQQGPTASSHVKKHKAATLVKDDVEPVRLLLQQLGELHDRLQKERTVRWSEFLRKVRAERRREGQVAAATAAAAAEARFLRAKTVMPETRLADGEIVGVAGLGNKGKMGRAKWNEFRTLVLGGIPLALRAKVWAECTGATSLRVPGAYEDLVAGRQSAGGDDDMAALDASGEAEAEAEVVAQIEADIHRTLTDNIFFREGPGTSKLNEVLLAYARRNREVGYCQGMNLIAANLLLVTPSAEDAFWLLASIVETILPAGYYDHSLAASRADQQVLRGYVGEVLPRLSGHFDALAIDLETMTFQWFLSVFTDCLSAEALFRVWDVVFCMADGSVFLFQVALALLKLNEAALLRCDSPAAVYTYINHQMTDHAISIDGLIQASEALRRLVRRDDVEARRRRAMDAERALAEARAAERKRR